MPRVGLGPQQRVHASLDRLDFGEVDVHGGEVVRLGEGDVQHLLERAGEQRRVLLEDPVHRLVRRADHRLSFLSDVINELRRRRSL